MKIRNDQRRFFKSRKAKIIIGVIIYLSLVSLFSYHFNQYFYDGKKVDQCEQIAEKIVYDGMESLDVQNITIDASDQEITVQYLMNNGLKYADYKNIKVVLNMKDMDIYCNKGQISFLLKNGNIKDNINFWLCGMPTISYKIVNDKLEINNNYMINNFIIIFVNSLFIILFFIFLILIFTAFILVIGVFLEQLKRKIQLLIQNKKRKKLKNVKNIKN